MGKRSRKTVGYVLGCTENLLDIIIIESIYRRGLQGVILINHNEREEIQDKF